MTPQEFSRCQTILEVTFNESLSSERSKIYFDLLGKYDFDRFKKACEELTRTRNIKGFPLPAEIIEAIEGTQTDKELIAWQMLLRGLADHGTYQTVQFIDDPVIHSVVEAMGGWMGLAGVDMDEWKKKEFCEYYRVYKKRKDHSEKLIGFLEADNRSKGLLEHIPGTILIGRRESKQLPPPHKALPEAEAEPIDRGKVRALIDKMDKEIKEDRIKKAKELTGKDRRLA